MYPHSLLWHYLWLAPLALQVVIVTTMIRRKLCQEFPMFLVYTIFQVVLNATLFVLDHAPSVTAYQYRYAEWVDEVGSIVLRFAVIQEVFSVVFRSYPALKELGTLVFRWTIAVLVLVAVAVAAYGAGGYGPGLLSGLALLDRAVAIVQCGLLLFLFLFSSYFGLSWRHYVFGIALGLGVFSSMQLATAAVQAEMGLLVPGSEVLDFIVMGTYHCSVLIWLFYLLVPERARGTARRVPSHNLEEWNNALQRLLQQ